MPFQLPPLPFAADALAPHMSEETLRYHHGKHHQAYVNNLNALVPNTAYEHLNLEDIIQRSASRPADQAIFNNAAQIWNHSFFWSSLTPEQQAPEGDLLQAIVEQFGSVEALQEQFTQMAVSTFGSGWAWLVKTPDRKLAILSTSNAATPITTSNQPLLTCDVWEHAYYIDHRNARAQYLKDFWHITHWAFASRNWQA